MSKWTWGQIGIVLFFTFLVVLNSVYANLVTVLFSFVEQWIPSSVLVVFFTVIIVVWSTALFLYFQKRKGKLHFEQKIWRIMPAIIGALIFLSFGVAVFLFSTSVSSMDATLFWLVDVSVIYFVVIVYLFILSLFIRYGKQAHVDSMIGTSAHTTVLLLFIVLWMLPGM